MVCDTEVAKNSFDEIIWPRGKSIAQICEDKMARERYAADKKGQAEAVAAEQRRQEQERANMRFQRGNRVRITIGKGNYWEGVITDKDNGNRIETQVDKVNVSGLHTGFKASECTGNIFLDYSKEGRKVWIPTWCVD
jgi:hypothetical protein